MATKPVMLITGTRQGVGRHLASYYAEHGYEVIGCSRGNADLVHENYHHFCLDVANELQLKEMFGFIRSNLGRLDVLINNAGIWSSQHVFLLTVEQIRALYDTNVVGNVLVTREAAKIMRKNKWGRIINFSSFAVPLAMQGTSLYSSSKSCIEQFAKVFAKEVAPYGITVNSVAFSCVKDSGMVENLSESSFQYLDQHTSLDVYISMQDVIYCLDFFLSERSGFITGQTIYTSGV